MEYDVVAGVTHDHADLYQSDPMIKLLLIGTGGFIGSILRYLVSGSVQAASHSIAFPYGTLAVNVAGCFLIGFLSELAEIRSFLSSDTRTFLIVGILGGFTTFSAFGNETMSLLRDGERALAMMNVSAQILLGLGAVWLGYSLAYQIWR
ncbi:MAG: fluoride efflux transporter CrcB [Nitrospira sp.]|nr:fluoride efflux transporter CrcB [Nitrospira sp.]